MRRERGYVLRCRWRMTVLHLIGDSFGAGDWGSSIKAVQALETGQVVFSKTPCRDGHGGCAWDENDQRRERTRQKKKGTEACVLMN